MKSLFKDKEKLLIKIVEKLGKVLGVPYLLVTDTSDQYSNLKVGGSLRVREVKTMLKNKK